MLISRRTAIGGLVGSALLPISGVDRADAQQIVDIGLPYLGIQTPRQNCPQWCWAASLQTIFGALGYSISQEYIVRRVMRSVNGELPCRGASDQEMLSAIDNRYADPNGKTFDGRYFLAKSRATHPLNYAWWDIAKIELAAGRPLLAAYNTGRFTGHAVVITHVRIATSPGLPDELITMTVRDPWPGSPNRRSLTLSELKELAFVVAVSAKRLA